MLPWGLSVCSAGLLNGNEGDGQEISTVWSYWQRKGEGFSLQAHTLFAKPAINPISCGSFREQLCHRHESKSLVYHKKHSSINVSDFLSLWLRYTDLAHKHVPLSWPDHYCCQPYLPYLGIFKIIFDWISFFLYPFLIFCTILFCYKCPENPMKYNGIIPLPAMLWQMKKGEKKKYKYKYNTWFL